MSVLIGDALPAPLLRLLDGTALQRRLGYAHYLITVDADGAPRPCMLGDGELLAPDSSSVRIAVWDGTSTCANLQRVSSVLLCFAIPDGVFHVRGTPSQPWCVDRHIQCFEIRVESVYADRHDGFRVSNPARVEMDDDIVDDYLQMSGRVLAALARGSTDSP